MNTRLALIGQRRRLLSAQAAAQRHEIVPLVQPWRAPLAVVDAGLAVARAARRYPFLAVLGVAFLIRAPHRRWGAWAGHLLTVWEIFHSLRQLRPKRRA